MIPTPVWILNKSSQNPPGQPGGGSPGEGYLRCVQSLKPILNRFIESVAPACENSWEIMKNIEIGKVSKILTNNNQVKGLF